jgi:hypothetical protein
MDVSFSKEIGAKGGTSRLFAGGVHGKEGSTTLHIIEAADDISILEGNLILCNLPPSPYLSTLDPLYYLSLTGSKLMGLIQKNRPDIYLELHCYRKDSYPKLTRSDRREVFGVPGLVELENKVLIGSVSPLIRSVFFDLDDFPFILEIPCNPPAESLQTCHKIMEILAGSSNRMKIMDKLSQEYPQQVKTLNTYFQDYSRNFHRVFQEIKQRALEIDLKNYQDLEKLINDVINEGSFEVNSRQIKQLEGAFLIFKEYNSFKCNKRTMNI